MRTERLEIRPTLERDRATFVRLFGDDDFMVFSGGVLDDVAANDRFDGMLLRSSQLPFAKQPVIDRSTDLIVGYVGVNVFDFENEERLEFGWRFVPQARGRGLATEATTAVLGLAAETFRGEILAMIDPRNAPSRAVAEKVGFTFWKQAVVGGFLDDLYRIDIGA